MKNKDLNFAIIGFGDRGYKVYKASQSLPFLNLKAICKRNPIALKDENLKNIKYYDNYIDVFNEKLDFVVLTTPHINHPEIIDFAAKKGVHILKEKPFALTSDEVKRYQELRDSYGIIINTFPQRMFSEKTKFIKEKLKTIGNIVAVNIEYNMHIKNPFDGWRGKISESGGGCISDQGYHMVHFLTYLFGSPKEVSAASNLAVLPENKDCLEDVTEHVANIQLSYNSGLIGNISLSRYHGPKSEFVKILGSKGYIIMSNDNIKTYKVDGEQVEERSFNNVPSYLLIKEQLQYFADIILNDKSDNKDFQDNIDSVRIIESAYKSSKMKMEQVL